MSEIKGFADYNLFVLNALKETDGLDAIAAVLKKPDQYLSGKKQLKDKHVAKIREKGIELKSRINHKAESEYRKELKEKLEAENSPIGDSLEKIFHRGGGRLWKIGEEFAFEGNIYKVSHVITNPLGLKMAVFVPKDSSKGIMPIISCNGTSSIQNAIDDLSKSIGLKSVVGSRDEIESMLKEVVQKYGPVRVGGHSLGGAIAQDITAMFCDYKLNNKSYIAECHYFNAPGPGKLIFKLYNQKKAQLEESGVKPPLIRSYRNEDDIIPLFGGPHLPPDHSVIAKDPRFKFSLNMILNAHMAMNFFSDKILMVKSVADDNPGSRLLESIRRKIAFVVKPILSRLYGNKDLNERVNLLKDYFQRNHAVTYHRP